MTRRVEVEAIAEDNLATAEARVIEWAVARQNAAEVSWRERDRATAQLDVVTRALIRLRVASTDGTGNQSG